MNRYFPAIAVGVFLIAGAYFISPSQSKAKNKKNASVRTASPLTFSDIQQLLKDRCGKCHGAEAEGELALLTYADLMNGGEHGAAVVPGKPEKSSLYFKLLPKPAFGKQMPKKGPKLTDEEVNLIKKWIEDGAKE